MTNSNDDSVRLLLGDKLEDFWEHCANVALGFGLPKHSAVLPILTCVSALISGRIRAESFDGVLTHAPLWTCLIKPSGQLKSALFNKIHSIVNDSFKWEQATVDQVSNQIKLDARNRDARAVYIKKHARSQGWLSHGGGTPQGFRVSLFVNSMYHAACGNESGLARMLYLDDEPSGLLNVLRKDHALFKAGYSGGSPAVLKGKDQSALAFRAVLSFCLSCRPHYLRRLDGDHGKFVWTVDDEMPRFSNQKPSDSSDLWLQEMLQRVTRSDLPNRLKLATSDIQHVMEHPGGRHYCASQELVFRLGIVLQVLEGVKGEELDSNIVNRCMRFYKDYYMPHADKALQVMRR